MNIYNKLFILEYTKNPFYHTTGYKSWYLYLSKIHSYDYHRNFDLPAIVSNDLYYYANNKCKSTKHLWCQYNKHHRLIGPALINYHSNYKKQYYKLCYIRDIKQ